MVLSKSYQAELENGIILYHSTLALANFIFVCVFDTDYKIL